MLLAAMNMLGINPEPGTAAAAAFVLILGIDIILDMDGTCINVTGDPSWNNNCCQERRSDRLGKVEVWT
jgi:hypothetical protein